MARYADAYEEAIRKLLSESGSRGPSTIEGGALMTALDRRQFLGIAGAATGMALGLDRAALARSPNEKIVVGVMGTSRAYRPGWEPTI
jgi:hypothetical protein